MAEAFRWLDCLTRRAGYSMLQSTDRNLLFGILALQVDFISREQLIAGMQAWLSSKHRPLSDHLERLGALSPANRHRLDSLVDAHVSLHSDDPAKSLASMASLENVRQELAQFRDCDVDASLATSSRVPGLYAVD